MEEKRLQSTSLLSRKSADILKSLRFPRGPLELTAVVPVVVVVVVVTTDVPDCAEVTTAVVLAKVTTVVETVWVGPGMLVVETLVETASTVGRMKEEQNVVASAS